MAPDIGILLFARDCDALSRARRVASNPAEAKEPSSLKDSMSRPNFFRDLLVWELFAFDAAVFDVAGFDTVLDADALALC